MFSRWFGAHALAHATNSPGDASSLVDTEADAGAPPTSAHWPSGELPHLTCAQAQGVMAVARAKLPYKPHAVTAQEFSDELGLWVDPTGAWKEERAIQDSLLPTARLLLAALTRDDAACAHALPLARALANYVNAQRANTLDTEGITHELGPRRAQLLAAFPDEAPALAEHLNRVLFPKHEPQEWDEIVIAAALRALVRLQDSHSEWAPPDEETEATGQRLYKSGPAPLWDQVTSAPLGVTVLRSSRQELREGDEIIWVQTARKPRLYLVGLSPEQCEQVAVTAGDEDDGIAVRIWRAQTSRFETLALAAAPAAMLAPRLQTDRLQTDVGLVPVLHIPEMYDELSEDVHEWLRANSDARGAPFAVLDLRGNGGGAVEPTLDLLGLWLGDKPALVWTNAVSGGAFQAEAAPPSTERWPIPVVVAVDAQTASAAEMLAGALQSYGYARVVGERSYGKGCMQETLELAPGTPGTLALTTALYALPNGRAVQRAGIEPDAFYTFTPKGEFPQREEQSKHVAPRWATRDIRPAHAAHAWSTRTPVHSIDVCSDAALCDAVRVALKLRRQRPQTPH